MAEHDQEKTEQKSQKKWEESRDKGELPRSQELATFVVFSVVIVYFYVVRSYWFNATGAVMTDLLQFDQYLGLTRESLGQFFLRPLLKVAYFFAPFFLIILGVSVTVNMSQTGFSFAKDKIRIDWNRLDPMKGLKKMVSLKAWVEGIKSVVKVALFGAVAFWTIKGALPEVVTLPALDLAHQLRFMVELLLTLGIRVTLLMAVLAVLDYGFQWRQFQQTLRMTPREVKEETKEHEGDPLIRQRMKSLRIQMSRNRMMSEVAHSDVVITNPTHYAVALAYNRDKMSAPYVSAKGRQFMARRIREIAAEHGVPILENPSVARALYRRVKVGEAVPSEFYRIIAELLAFVYLLKQRAGGAKPSMVQPIRAPLKAKLPDRETSARLQ